MKISSRKIAIIAALAAVSAVLQIFHFGPFAQWGMWIDLVAVTWLMALFLFDVRAAVLISIVGAIIITLFAPETWLGATMKWLATMPMWLSLALIKRDFSYAKNLILPLILGLFLRCLIILPVNYYFAIPLWTGMTSTVAIKTIPWFIIAGFNAAQGIIEVGLAWILTYRFGFSRYGRN